MKHLLLPFIKRLLPLAGLLLCLPAAPSFAQSVPAAMNFQGRLAKPDGTPVADGTYNVTFSLYTAASGGTLLWQKSVPGLAVHNGAFAARLDYSSGFQNGATLASTFSGSPVYLDISINGGASLIPRQQFGSNAYTFTANTANTALSANSVANGSITASAFAPNIFNPIAWLLGGNSGTNGTQFLGTTDNNPLVVKVNGHQAMRYQYAENLATSTPDPNDAYRSVNVLGGSEVNSIKAGAVGATVAGGGKDYISYYSDEANTVTGDFGTVGGGLDNLAGNEATVGGGYRNQATGQDATIPGGLNNRAVGAYSFAAGQNAFANHDGCFVWNDNSVHGNDVDSTGVNQFLIHATGGVGIGTNAPLTMLDIVGGLTIDHTYLGSGSLDSNAIHFGANSGEGIGSKRNAGGNLNGIDFYTASANRLSITNGGNVGIGTTSPAYKLDVNGQVHASNVSVTSDARYKTRVFTLANALDDLLNLRGVSYDWDRAKWPAKNFSDERQFGFIAQELEQIFPELVQTDKEGYKSVNYIGVVPVLVEAVKTLNTKVDKLTKENAELKKQNDRLTTLEKQLAALAAAMQKMQDGNARK